MAPSFARRRLAAIVLAGSLAIGVAALAASGGTDAAPSATSTTTATAVARATPSTVDVAAVVPSDRFAVAPGTGEVVGTGRPRTYTVEVEEGIPIDVGTFAAIVDEVLADPRGWTAPGDVALQRVGPGAEPSFRVRLATPTTTDAHCAPLDTHGELSCRNGADVMLNLDRWVSGAAPSQLPLARYHEYMISHEVGHALGHDHVACPARGQQAPVMLQQTLGLGGCIPNPWPFPGAG